MGKMWISFLLLMKSSILHILPQNIRQISPSLIQNPSYCCNGIFIEYPQNVLPLNIIIKEF